METIRSLGLLDLEPVVTKDGTRAIPRDVFVACVGPRLTKPKSKDMIALRVVVEGSKNGHARRHAFDLIDLYDETHGISAMMRSTGYSLSITGQLQAMGAVTPLGVHTPDECMPAERYIAELAKRGIRIEETVA